MATRCSRCLLSAAMFSADAMNSRIISGRYASPSPPSRREKTIATMPQASRNTKALLENSATFSMRGRDGPSASIDNQRGERTSAIPKVLPMNSGTLELLNAVDSAPAPAKTKIRRLKILAVARTGPPNLTCLFPGWDFYVSLAVVGRTYNRAIEFPGIDFRLHDLKQPLDGSAPVVSRRSEATVLEISPIRSLKPPADMYPR